MIYPKQMPNGYSNDLRDRVLAGFVAKNSCGE